MTGDALRFKPRAALRTRPSPAVPHALGSSSSLTLREVEQRHIEAVFRDQGENQARAALTLGIDRKTLRTKLREYGILAAEES